MAPERITQNTLFYGDNLPILREYIADQRVGVMSLGVGRRDHIGNDCRPSSGESRARRYGV